MNGKWIAGGSDTSGPKRRILMKMKAAIYTGIEQIAIREVERNEPPPGLCTR